MSQDDRVEVGIVLFPNVTQLDFTGPLQILGRIPGAEIHLVAGSLDPIQTDGVLRVLPTATFENCPPLDLMMVPGGFGVDDAMIDPALMDFVRREGARARWLTSVCTGAFVLAAAGLLEGKRATTHWAYHDALARFGAIPEKARVVKDGKVFTGGGVTAGLDFAFEVVAEVAGEDLARGLQLAIEYDPAPPFQSGHPDRASRATLDMVEPLYRARRQTFDARVTEILGESS